MKSGNTETSICLGRLHTGDPKGMNSLIERHLPWIHNHVRKRMGPLLRNKGETCDYVQDAMIQFLRYGPRIMISDEDHFRRLIIRIVENALRDKHDWYTALRRRTAKERPLSRDTVLSLDPPRDTVETPSRAVQHNEDEAWIRLGLELLAPGDRDLIVLHQWEKHTFTDIGQQLGISADAARMRHNTALSRLGEVVWMLQSGKLDHLLDERPPGEPLS